MPSPYFIRESADFVRLFRYGKVEREAGWMLYYAPNRMPFPRFAVIVSKRNLRRAVARNRLRRQLRENFRQEWRLHLPAADFVIRAKVPLKGGRDMITATARRVCLRLFSLAAKQR